MNKKSVVISAVILLMIALGVAYLAINSNPTSNQSPSQQSVNDSNQTQKSNSNDNTKGQYIDYKDGSIQNNSGTKVLFFHAPWCPQCRQLESEIESGSIPANVTIFKVDYDTNQDLRAKYGVTLQTTLVKVNDNGDLVKKFVAYDNPTLQSIKDNIL